MRILGIDHKQALRAVFSANNIPAAIALAVIIGAGIFADYQNRVVFEERLRNDVLSEVSVVRAKLEGNINANIQLVRGLISTLATEPDMTQPRFAQLASNIFGERSQLRNIAGAPDFVVSLMYPLEGNERAIGLDYRDAPTQREAAMRAWIENKLVIAGPVDLVQGGQGFVGRFPVTAENEDGEPFFWGIISAVIDVERLYDDSGLLDPNLNIEIGLIGRDATGVKGTQFFGSPTLADQHPVQSQVTLPSGSWQIIAAPKGGWGQEPDNAWWLRLLIVGAGLLAFVPIVIAGRLVRERLLHIGQLRNREDELERLSRRLGLALDTSQVGVWEMDILTNTLLWDDRMNELYGLPADGGERGYVHWRSALHPDDAARAAIDFEQALASGSYHSEYRVVLPNGEHRNIRAIGAVYRDVGTHPKILGVNWDVTADVQLNDDLKREKSLADARYVELEAAKVAIEHNSLHDSLTGLPNRRYLDDVLWREAAKTGGAGIALLHIDLDRFKQINDTLGHAAGDAMLVHASQVLKDNVGANDFVARIGGDEFVVVCTASETTDALAEIADRIITEMRQPVPYQGHECRFGVSIGIAQEAAGDIDPKRILINADIALYRAKGRGRNRHEFFSEELQAEVVNTKRLADEILSGLDRAEFIAFYQPQFCARTFDVAGVEALARWKHPTRGILAPDQFLGVAEELNVLATIDRLILEQTIAHRAKWEAAGCVVPRVSVNVSSRRLHDENLIAGLRQLDIAPGTLSFELVESIYLDESDEVVAWNIEQIKELGYDIEIDDFGTGYASIVSLMKLKPRRLKVDRQLVMPIVTSRTQRQLVQSIIDIGKSLGIEVVAEGVETMEHAAILRDIGCDFLQGYAFARPLSVEDLTPFLLAEGWRGPAPAPKRVGQK